MKTKTKRQIAVDISLIAGLIALAHITGIELYGNIGRGMIGAGVWAIIALAAAYKAGGFKQD